MRKSHEEGWEETTGVTRTVTIFRLVEVVGYHILIWNIWSAQESWSVSMKKLEFFGVRFHNRKGSLIDLRHNGIRLVRELGLVFWAPLNFFNLNTCFGAPILRYYLPDWLTSLFGSSW